MIFRAAMLLLAGCVPAAAGASQDATRIGGPPDAVRQVRGDSETAAARALGQFTACNARTYRRSSEALLALPYGSREQARAVRRMYGGDSECYRVGGRALRVSSILIVGGLAEYYVRGDFEPAALGRIAGLSDEEVAARALTPRNGSEDMALCIVRRDARAAWALVSAEPGSEEEAGATRSLVPNLGPCVPAGMTVNVNPPALRALLAVGLYRALAATH